MQKALDLKADEALECFESIPHGSFSLGRFASCMGPDAAVGALRISVGIPTVSADLDRLEEFLTAFVARMPEELAEAAAAP